MGTGKYMALGRGYPHTAGQTSMSRSCWHFMLRDYHHKTLRRNCSGQWTQSLGDFGLSKPVMASLYPDHRDM
jgi:hypothetical protein